MTDGPDTLAFVLGTASFADLLDNLDLLGRIGRQDERIAKRVKSARDGAADARRRTRAARVEAALVETSVASATTEQRGIVSRLVASRDALVAARQEKSTTLASIQSDRESTLVEIDALEQQSASLAARIRRRSARPRRRSSHRRGAACSAGPFRAGDERLRDALGADARGDRHRGRRGDARTRGRGRHGRSTPGWMSGYGNLVAIDHGNGLSTAYAHNSSLAASVGQSVAAGEVVSYSGNTGNSTGPHVHFEVRVNGSAVDPLGYL